MGFGWTWTFSYPTLPKPLPQLWSGAPSSPEASFGPCQCVLVHVCGHPLNVVSTSTSPSLRLPAASIASIASSAIHSIAHCCHCLDPHPICLLSRIKSPGAEGSWITDTPSSLSFKQTTYTTPRQSSPQSEPLAAGDVERWIQYLPSPFRTFSPFFLLRNPAPGHSTIPLPLQRCARCHALGYNIVL